MAEEKCLRTILRTSFSSPLDSLSSTRRLCFLEASRSGSKPRILERAKDQWVEYKPSERGSLLAGVDSSYNRQQFQGFHLYVVDAVCVGNEGSVLAKDFVSRIERVDQGQLEARSMEMETGVASEAVSKTDLVLIDGSMASRFVGSSANSSRIK